MPIRGLTDVEAGFTRLGYLRKGGPKTDNRPGAELDHFRVHSQDAEVMRAFRETFGENVKKIAVFLPNPIPLENFQTSCEVRDANGLVHRCDGEYMSLWRETVTVAGQSRMVYRTGHKACNGGHKDNDPLSNALGRLEVILAREVSPGVFYPALVEYGFVGTFCLETHSKNDIIQITRQLKSMQSTYDETGRPIPMHLVREEQMIGAPGFGEKAGGRTRVKKYLAFLKPAPSWIASNFQAQFESGMPTSAPALDSGRQAPALPAATGNPAPVSAPAVQAPPPQRQPAPQPQAVKKHDSGVEFESLGQKLWLTKWPDVKKAIMADKNSVDEALAYVKQRLDDVTTSPNNLEKHIAKAFPGFESMLDSVLISLDSYGIKYDPLKIMEGIATLAGRGSVEGLSNEDKTSIVLSKFGV